MTLKLRVSSDFQLDDSRVGEPIELDGLLWTLHAKGAHMFETDCIVFHVECQSIEKDALFKLKADVDFKASHDAGCCPLNIEMNQEVPRKVQIGQTINIHGRKNRIFVNDLYSVEFEAKITIKTLEVFPRYPFDYKDDKLSDIAVIVGDKKFYTTKKILALNSEKLHQMISDKVDQIEIKDSSWHIVHRFLEVLHGFDCRWLLVDEFHDFAEISLEYNSKRCLEHCEKSYLKMTQAQKNELNAHFEHSESEVARKYYQGISLLKSFEKTEILKIFDSESPIKVNGIPFKIRTKVDENQKNLQITIECLHQDTFDSWEYSGFVKYSGELELTYYLNFTASNRARNVSVPWNNGKVECHLTIESWRHVFPKENIDFEVSRDNLTDIVLSVGDKKFHVSKQILANFSSYFYTMIYSDFNEKHKTDIPLIGIDKDEFDEFLQHVYNPKRVVKDSTIEYLLELSSYYNAETILEKCKNFISNDSSIDVFRRFEISIRFELDDIIKQQMPKITKFEDFIKLSGVDGFNDVDWKKYFKK